MLWSAAGVLILAGNALDIVWTALGTHGGGPISTPVTDGVWKIARAAHKRRPNHRALSFVGSINLVVLLSWWILLLWVGWFCMFNARTDSVVDPHTRKPAETMGRIYYTAYAISTMGNGDFVPTSTRWRMTTSIATLSGFMTVSMTITFLMSVLSAVVVTRTLGSYISDLGRTPIQILTRSWDGKNFDSLNDHFLDMTGMIHTFTEQHLAYPVLQYFHSEHERTATALRLAALHELVLLLCHGVAEEVRMPPMVILPMEDALEAMGRVLGSKFIKSAENAPPPPPLDLLRSLSIPTADEKDYAEAVRACEDSRRFFAGLLKDDGWPWERIWTGERAPVGG